MHYAVQVFYLLMKQILVLKAPKVRTILILLHQFIQCSYPVLMNLFSVSATLSQDCMYWILGLEYVYDYLKMAM